MKQIKTIIMALAWIMVSISTVYANQSSCKIEEARLTNSILGPEIQGTTTCLRGIIYMRIYIDEEYVGNTTGLVNGYTFSAYLDNIDISKGKLSYKYSIETY